MSGGGEKSTANKMKVLSFLFPQISFSAAPALKDCSHGPFFCSDSELGDFSPFLPAFSSKIPVILHRCLKSSVLSSTACVIP